MCLGIVLVIGRWIMVKQFSVDIVVPDDEDFTEKDLDRCITSYAYA